MNNDERDDNRIGVDDFLASFGDDKDEAIKQLWKRVMVDMPPPPKPQRTGGLAQEVKNRIDIVDMISGYVALERSGRNFKGVCPFHTEIVFLHDISDLYAERTPSFFVFPERQTWRCFGSCADGGDALAFIMKVENIGFSDALEMLSNALNDTDKEIG